MREQFEHDLKRGEGFGPPVSAALLIGTEEKEAAMMAMILGRSTPDPGVGSPVELSGRGASGLLNLVGIGKALTRQGIASIEPPPALLQVEEATLRWE